MRIRCSNLLTLTLMLISTSARAIGSTDAPNRAVASGRDDIVYLAPATEPYEAMAIGNGQLGVMVGNHGGAGMSYLFNHGSFFASADQNQDLMSSGQVEFALPETWMKGFVEQRMVLHDSIVETKFATGSAKHTIKSWLAEGLDLLVIQIDSDEALPELSLRTWVWERPRRPEPGLGPGPKTSTWAGTNESSLDSVGLSNQRAVSLLIYPLNADAIVKQIDDRTITLTIPAKADRKHLDILIANPCLRKNPVTTEDARAEGARIIADASKTGLDPLRQRHDAYWRDFWSKSSIVMSSDDGLADYYENIHNLFLYWMAASSRGADAPKFNGENFIFYQDWRGWGGQYWFNNTREMYWPLLATDHADLFAPFIDLYWRHLPEAQKLARDMYDSPGANFEETLNGYDGGGDKRSNTSTCLYLTSGTEMAHQLYQCTLYTGDEKLLREKVYPLMKEVIAFHLSFVNKESDGFYHVYPSNPRETLHWTKDSITDIAALRATLAALVEASKKLNVDADQRDHWQDVADHLAPFVFNESTGMYRPAILFDDYPPTRFAKVEAVYPKDNGSRSALSQMSAANVENVESDPIYPWNLFNLDSSTKDLQQARSSVLKRRINEVTIGNAWDPAVIWCARLGLTDEAVKILRQFAANVQIFPNGMSGTPGRSPVEWGRQITDSPAFDSAGVTPTAVQEMMLQSFNHRIRVYPAWPKGWRSEFTLAAQHGFVVSSLIGADGAIPLIKITSRRGGKVDVVNPWKNDGSTIALNMKSGESIELHPETPIPARAPIEVKRNDGPKWPTHTAEMNTAEAYLDRSSDFGFIGITKNGRNPARDRVHKALTPDTYPTSPKTLFLAHFDKTLDADVAGGDGKAIASGVAINAGGADVGYSGDEHATLSYDARGNIDSKQGTISFWLSTAWDWDARVVKPHPALVSIPLGVEPGKSINIYAYMPIPSAANAYLGFYITDGKTQGSVYCPASPTPGWKKNEWHHVTATWNEWRLQLFVDGKLIESRFLSKRLDLSAPAEKIYVGCYPNVSLSPNSDRSSGVVIDELEILDQPINTVSVQPRVK